MSEADVDDRVRARAFEFLRQQRDLHGEILSHAVLLQGFEFDGRRVPLPGELTLGAGSKGRGGRLVWVVRVPAERERPDRSNVNTQIGTT